MPVGPPPTDPQLVPPLRLPPPGSRQEANTRQTDHEKTYAPRLARSRARTAGRPADLVAAVRPFVVRGSHTPGSRRRRLPPTGMAVLVACHPCSRSGVPADLRTKLVFFSWVATHALLESAGVGDLHPGAPSTGARTDGRGRGARGGGTTRPGPAPRGGSRGCSGATSRAPICPAALGIKERRDRIHPSMQSKFAPSTAARGLIRAAATRSVRRCARSPPLPWFVFFSQAREKAQRVRVGSGRARARSGPRPDG